MANVNPLLKCIIEIRHRLESGESLRLSLNSPLTDDQRWNQTLKKWFLAAEHGSSTEKIVKEQSSPYRRMFLELLGAGLQGSPIHQTLVELEKDVKAACELEIEGKLKRLPFLSMLPILFLMFPAFLILLIGPAIMHLLKELSQ